MNEKQDNLILRPIAGREELDLFCRLPYVLNEELADDLSAGRRRPEWMWVALLSDRVLARAAWWCQTGQSVPFLLDVFDIDDNAGEDRVDIAVRLLRTAMAEVVPAGTRPPEYCRAVPPQWRDDDVARRVTTDRLTALEHTGARPLVERLRFEWRPGTPIPEPSRRLRFRPIHDTAELLALMTEVLEGTLDAHSTANLTRMSARDAAVQHFEEELAHYRSPRDWWRIATLPDGAPVGFVTPARNDYNPVIGYIAVLPAHRGQGYVDEILAAGTRVLAAQRVPRIRAATDVGNTPMANAFQRLGYVNFADMINMTWD